MVRAFRSVLVGAASVAWALAPAPVGAAGPNPAPPAADGWGEWLSYYRGLAGLAPVSIDAGLSDGAWQHSRYMVRTGHFAHDQDVPSPYASPAGREAASHGNIYGSSGALPDTREPIDGWADSLGHALWMLNPRLRTVGFGQFTDPASGTGLVTAATLDVLSAPQGPYPGTATEP